MPRRVSFHACWLTLLFLVLPTSPLAADASDERAELLRRLRAARHAVVGSVIDIQPRLERNRFGDTLIVSELSLQVTEVVRGGTPALLRLDVEGGTLNGFTLKVSDMPEMPRGARAVFLLRALQDDRAALSERGASILPLASDDSIPGSHLTLRDVRQLARQVAQ